MRDPNRIEVVLDKLKDIWSDNPDLRLGQLISNAIDSNVLYFVEDHELIHTLNDFYRVAIKDKDPEYKQMTIFDFGVKEEK